MHARALAWPWDHATQLTWLRASLTTSCQPCVGSLPLSLVLARSLASFRMSLSFFSPSARLANATPVAVASARLWLLCYCVAAGAALLGHLADHGRITQPAERDICRHFLEGRCNYGPAHGIQGMFTKPMVFFHRQRLLGIGPLQFLISLSDDSVDVRQIWQLQVGGGGGVLALREAKSHVFCHILENKGPRCGYQILIFEVARSLGDTLATLDRNRN